MTDPAHLQIASLIAQAEAAVARGDVLEGLSFYQFAVELAPTNSAALTGKIRTLLQIGDVEQAARTCDDLYQAAPTPALQALHEVVVTLANAQTPPRHINIGGGAAFNITGWLNLAPDTGPTNPIPTVLSPTLTFPVADACVRTVYAAHTFEHLDVETLNRCLFEALRVLDPQGILIVKQSLTAAPLNDVLATVGFEIVSTDAPRICQHHAHIPELATERDANTYTLAAKGESAP